MTYCPHCGCGCRSRSRWGEVSLGLMELALDVNLVVGRLLANRVSRHAPVERKTIAAVREAIKEGSTLVGRAQAFAKAARLPVGMKASP